MIETARSEIDAMILWFSLLLSLFEGDFGGQVLAVGVGGGGQAQLVFRLGVAE